jgi:hypothetical protein
MAGAEWYLRKAGECARLAREASDPRRRSEYETEELLWRKIAAQIEANERNRFRSDPV